MVDTHTIQRIKIEFNQNNKDYYLSESLLNKMHDIADNILPNIIVKKAFNVPIEDIVICDFCTIYTFRIDDSINKITNIDNVYMCKFYYYIKSLQDIQHIFQISFCLNAEIELQKEIDKLAPIARTHIRLQQILELNEKG